MSDKVFVDTNLLVYFISDEKKKKLQARDVLFSNDNVYVSSQVISEFVSVCFSKKLLKAEEITSLTEHFLEAFSFAPVEESTIKRALQIKKKTHYSFWDSLIVASARENDCSILFTEDLQGGQIIDGKLTIIDPFSMRA
jgi:predicted nucleic acid-binding protein